MNKNVGHILIFMPQEVVIDFNKMLTLACIYIYYENSLRSRDDTLSNIYGHIKVVMSIICCNYIDIKNTKTTLQHLANENCLEEKKKQLYNLCFRSIKNNIKHPNSQQNFKYYL